VGFSRVKGFEEFGNVCFPSVFERVKTKQY